VDLVEIFLQPPSTFLLCTPQQNKTDNNALLEVHTLPGFQQPEKNVMLMCLHIGYKEHTPLEVCKVFFAVLVWVFFKIDSITHTIHSRVRIFMPMQFVSKDSSHCGAVEQKRKNLPSVSVKLTQLLLMRTVVRDCFS